MKNFEELIEFIKKNFNKNWQDKLKKAPYNLKSVKQFESNPNWWMLVYDLYESDFKSPIVRQARGTVVEVLDNGTVKVVCGPYTKFFNWDDPNSALKDIDWDSARVYEKVDGQLIKMFKYSGRDYWCTNGGTGLNTPLSYQTDEIKDYGDLMKAAIEKADPSAAVKVSRGIVNGHENVTDFSVNADWVDKVPDGWTLMFELTSPQNRIVVKYSDTKLWLHGARDSEGNEHFPEEVIKKFGLPFCTPKAFKGVAGVDAAFDSYLKNMNGYDMEGLVICDKNFNRIKVKCDSYLNLKFARDNDTPEGIWRLVITEEYDDILPFAPELKDKIDAQVKEVIKTFKEIESALNHAKDTWNNDFEGSDRKGFALWVQKNIESAWRPLYFRIASGVPVSKVASDLKDKMISSSKGYDLYKNFFKKVVICP